MSGLIANAVFFRVSTAFSAQIQSSGWILVISLSNVDGDGVEHPDKTLLYGGIGSLAGTVLDRGDDADCIAGFET